MTFERVPPQDLDAEQSVLGGMLLSKDAIADVVEVLKGHDFYRPAHQTVYQAILDLYAKGEPADPITIAAELTKRGDIGRVGGPGYLHSLVQSVPTAANAEYYAEIVHEQAVLRRLVEAGTRITQMGYAADGDVDEIVNSAQAEIYAVTEEQTSEDYLPLAEIMEGALDEIEAIGSRSGQMTGVPTGFTDLDSLTNGLHPGQMVVVAARPAMGKALALDTPLPTPRGWTTMGEVGVGDLLIGADGHPTRVTAVSGVMTGRPCFEVGFDDGTTVVADAEHQWLTDTRGGEAYAGGEPAVRTTREIAESLRGTGTDRRPTHWVRNAPPLTTAEQPPPVSVPAYVLGVWLAGGHAGAARVGGVDPEIIPGVEAEGCDMRETGRGTYDLCQPAVSPTPTRCERRGVCAVCGARHAVFEERLACLGVLGDQHVPVAYARGPVERRRALLAGLLDVAGWPAGDGAVRLSVPGRRLAEDVRELIVGLGHGCEVFAPEDGLGRTASYVLVFSTSEDVFRLERKRLAHKEVAREHVPSRGGRYVTVVRPVPSVPVACVRVDNAAHMYLAGESMIPTHNSTLALDFARACSIKSNLPSVIFSLEMGRNEIAMRLLSAEARVALHHMRSGNMTDDDWTRLARQMAGVTDAPLYIDDSPNLSMMEIRAKCRRLKQRNDLHLVVIDYLQLMQTGGSRRPESRQQEVSEMSRNLKLLAKELEVPVVALSQLNRGPEQRTDKKPMVSDLRESGCLTADTTVLRADTGAPVSFRQLMSGGYEGVLVWSLDEHRRLTPAPITNVFSSGTKPVHRLRLASGREVKATGNHPFLTFGGWTPLDDLATGDRIAVPRRTPEPVGSGLGWSEHRIGLLAHLLGEGCVLGERPVHYTSRDEANLDFVEAAAAAEFGVTPRRVARGAWWRSYLPAPHTCPPGRRDPLHVWFAELGIEDLRAYEARIPDALYSASDDEVATFLRHLWATEGSVWLPKPDERQGPRVFYSTTSRPLADGVARLLSRFGIIAWIREDTTDQGLEHPRYEVDVSDGPGTRAFCRHIGVHGQRDGTAAGLGTELDDRAASTQVDSPSREAWGLVEAERLPGATERPVRDAVGTEPGGAAPYESRDARERRQRCAEGQDSAEPRAVASDDVFWDRVVEIEPLGEQPVYDATVKGTHNFIADGIAAHNSIEQDADMVILLHREDAYEKESPRAGEADLIVAKHRNGPTATITVAFQGHYSRFQDMANGM
ncbi:replicative DNA helicase [Streptomyces oceani]|uniref:Replicative DNA helicase n=1 Tax=Streptomyces oceani TaxID=1075402 RepID=A0A1E7JWW2_9ACTN|nr:replicative DNA helicase [Streptomyces oceani]